MKIAILQLDAQIGQVKETIQRATSILQDKLTPGQVDLLVLGELAFTGYNFPDLESIRPYLEPTTGGVSTEWAEATAKQYRCHVIVGYPEIRASTAQDGAPRNYNSTVTVGPDGSILATYSKSFLYYTDESWADEGTGFYTGSVGSLGHLSHAVCMDINPKEFTAPWDAYEFANHCLQGQGDLVVLSNAWLTHTPVEELQAQPQRPDLSTLSYWIERLNLLMTDEQKREFTVVIANRCGSEPHLNRTIHTKNGKVIELDDPVAAYAGSSCVLRFSETGVALHGILGQHEEGLLVVDTEQEPIPIWLKHAANDVSPDDAADDTADMETA